MSDAEKLDGRKEDTALRELGKETLQRHCGWLTQSGEL
jgi:hypothetical protein